MEKWKTYPCKNCLLKNSCDTFCFIIPGYNDLDEHLVLNQLNHKECLGCGSIDMNYPYSINSHFSCLQCNYKHKYPSV